MRDFGLEAQRAAEAHLGAVYDDFLDHDANDVAFAPFCGCDTCIVREILSVAWPILLEAAKEELADRVGAEQEDQPQRHRDGDQTDVTGSECHVVTLPLRSDVQA